MITITTKIDYKCLLLNIFLPLFLGSFIGYVTAPYNNYNNIKLPSFAPLSIVFPIVWSIFYILMGISSYLIIKSNSNKKYDALFIYGIQLIINLFWSIWFFIFRFYLFSFIWIILLIICVGIMIRKFFDINKISAYIQIPYLLWLLFACILNLFVYFLNM